MTEKPSVTASGDEQIPAESLLLIEALEKGVINKAQLEQIRRSGCVPLGIVLAMVKMKQER